MNTPQRQQRLRARDASFERAKLDFEKHGWERAGQDHWQRHTSASTTNLALDSEPKRSWRVTVETGGEVMNLSFRSRSFGAAVSEANRCYNLAHASEEQAEIDRERRLDEHYGRERINEREDQRKQY